MASCRGTALAKRESAWVMDTARTVDFSMSLSATSLDSASIAIWLMVVSHFDVDLADFLPHLVTTGAGFPRRNSDTGLARSAPG